MWDNSSYGAVIYDEWDCTNVTESPGRCFGMHYDRVGGARHGVVRIEYNNGSIEEGTWYGYNVTGRHGMRRLVTDREIFVQIWYFDKLILHSAFGEDFVERDRYDTSRANSDLFMSEVAPFKFSRERNDKEMLEAMLQSEPPALYRFSPRSRVMWRVSKPIESGYFEEFWGKTNSS
jgi:hypothetical protein